MLASRRIVIAPHCDDEIIFAYSEIKKGVDIVIFLEWNPIRRKEAMKVAKRCKFRPIFDYEFEKYVQEGDTLFVPCMFDGHLDHKSANERAKRLKVSRLVACSTDKNIPCFKLDTEIANEKREVLAMYKSQQKYDEMNELYINYEGYLEIRTT